MLKLFEVQEFKNFKDKISFDFSDKQYSIKANDTAVLPSSGAGMFGNPLFLRIYNKWVDFFQKMMYNIT